MDDSLKNLPPHERLKALRQLQEKKKRELEELEKERQRELEETEDQVQASLEELAEDERAVKEQLSTLQDQLETLEEQALEAVISDNVSGDVGSTYRSENSYTPINTIVEDLNRLQYTPGWNRDDQDLYRQRKEELQQTNQYRATLSEDITSQLDTAKSILDRLGYRH